MPNLMILTCDSTKNCCRLSTSGVHILLFFPPSTRHHANCFTTKLERGNLGVENPIAAWSGLQSIAGTGWQHQAANPSPKSMGESTSTLSMLSLPWPCSIQAQAVYLLTCAAEAAPFLQSTTSFIAERCSFDSGQLWRLSGATSAT